MLYSQLSFPILCYFYILQHYFPLLKDSPTIVPRRPPQSLKLIYQNEDIVCSVREMSQGLGRLIFFLFNFQRKASRSDEECWGIERKIKKKNLPGYIRIIFIFLFIIIFLTRSWSSSGFFFFFLVAGVEFVYVWVWEYFLKLFSFIVLGMEEGIITMWY